MTPPVRIERALRLLPNVEALEPLRMLLLSVAETDASRRWSSSGPYETLSKRAVDIETLRARVDHLLPRISAHITTLYDAYLRALLAWEAGDGAAAADALSQAGAEELRARRPAQAYTWFESAFRIASELNDRRPEIDVLGQLGETSLALDRPADAGRYYQRLLVLAEAGFDHAGVISACHGLGLAALARHHDDGARAWCLRGLRQATNGDYPLLTVELEQTLATVAWRTGNVDDARERLARARELCETIDAPAAMARVLWTRGAIETELGKTADAVASLREALAWARRAGGERSLQVDVAIGLADAQVAAGNLVDAERELRTSEQFAIDERLTDRLVSVYVAMGRLCVTKKDETGFVFFEQAMDLCRMMAPGASTEGRVFEEYGRFRQHFGQREEAQAHFERAARLFESLHDDEAVQRLRHQLATMTA